MWELKFPKVYLRKAPTSIFEFRYVNLDMARFSGSGADWYLSAALIPPQDIERRLTLIPVEQGRRLCAEYPTNTLVSLDTFVQ